MVTLNEIQQLRTFIDVEGAALAAAWMEVAAVATSTLDANNQDHAQSLADAVGSRMETFRRVVELIESGDIQAALSLTKRETSQ